MEALSSLIMPAAIFIGLFLLAQLGHQILSLAWSLLMSSYSLSLPGLLWGGTWKAMPTFISPEASPIMHFYYWFMLFGFLAILVTMVLNAFRHLAIWGKFDEQQQIKSDGFAKQFLWVIALIFMTFLTPIIVWAVYSVFMLGVLFLNQLAGSSLVLSISQNDWNILKEAMVRDLSALENVDVKQLQTFLTKLASDPKVIEFLRSKFGTDYSGEVIVQQILWDMRNLASQLNTDTAKDLLAKAASLRQAISTSGWANPISSSILNEFQTAVMSFKYEVGNIKVEQIGDYWVVKHSFWYCWQWIFANNNFTFEELINKSDQAGTETAQLWINAYKNFSGKVIPTATNPFTVFGHGGFGVPSNETACVLDRLAGTAGYSKVMYSNLEHDESAFYITFKEGEEVGLKTCPMEIYLNALITGNSAAGPEAVKSVLRNEIFQAIGGFGLLIGGSYLTKMELPIFSMGVTHALMPVGLAGIIMGMYLMITSIIPLLIQLFLYFTGFKMVITPIIGLVMFLWASFFEAAWYFLLLLPAIGTCVGERGTETYKQTWKNMFGKMATVLVMWGGLLLLVAAMGCINGFTKQILDSLKGVTDQELTNILIEFDFGDLKGLMVTGLNVISFNLNIQAFVQFLLAVVCLNLASKFMKKLGTLGFGEEAYADLDNYMAHPLNAAVPGGAAMLTGALNGAKMAGNFIGTAYKNKDRVAAAIQTGAKSGIARAKSYKNQRSAMREVDKAVTNYQGAQMVSAEANLHAANSKSISGRMGWIQKTLNKGGLKRDVRKELVAEYHELEAQQQAEFAAAGDINVRRGLSANVELAGKNLDDAAAKMNKAIASHKKLIQNQRDESHVHSYKFDGEKGWVKDPTQQNKDLQNQLMQALTKVLKNDKK